MKKKINERDSVKKSCKETKIFSNFQVKKS